MAGRPRTRSDEEIFAAVVRAAARGGARGATMADIASEAGLAPSTLSERFGSKRALLLAAGRTAADGVAGAFAAAEAREPAPLAALAAALVQISAGVRTRAALAHHLGALQLDIADPDFRRLAKRHATGLGAQVTRLLARALEAGALSAKTDVVHLARTVQVTYHGALISWGVSGRGSLEAALRDALDAVLGPWLQPSPREARGAERYDHQLQQELLALADADQRFRRTWAELDGDAIDEAMATEHARAARLAEIVDERGWPSAPMVGDEATQAAWLIVQHADHDVDFQERALELLAAAVERGEAPRSIAALLTDRVCVNRGRPQIYGTQFFGHGASFGPRPIGELETLDARRSAAGLEPFATYEQRMHQLDDEHGDTRTHVR